MKPIGVESELAQTVSRFLKEKLGHGPIQIRTRWIDDMVVVRFHGPVTAFEDSLAETNAEPRAFRLARQLRQELIDIAHLTLDTEIARLTGKNGVLTVLSDVNVSLSESVIVFLLED